MKFDKNPPIRFIFLNWVLVVSISPLLLLLYTIIEREKPLFENFDIGMVFIYFASLLWSMAFSFFSVFIFGSLATILNNAMENERAIKIILIITTWFIIHFTFVFYIQDRFMKPGILWATNIYWLVSVFTTWFIPLNKD